MRLSYTKTPDAGVGAIVESSGFREGMFHVAVGRAWGGDCRDSFVPTVGAICLSSRFTRSNRSELICLTPPVTQSVILIPFVMAAMQVGG